MEAYNHKTNEWTYVGAMNTRRSSVGVGVVNGDTELLSDVASREDQEVRTHISVSVFVCALQVSCTQWEATTEHPGSVSAPWRSTTLQPVSGATLLT